MLLFSKYAEFWAPISTIPFFSSSNIFLVLVCCFFPKGIVFGAILIYVALTEGSKNYAHIYNNPFNVNFPGHQSP